MSLDAQSETGPTEAFACDEAVIPAGAGIAPSERLCKCGTVITRKQDTLCTACRSKITACIDCGTSLEGRHPSTIRCLDCAREVAAVRKCLACGKRLIRPVPTQKFCSKTCTRQFVKAEAQRTAIRALDRKVEPDDPEWAAKKARWKANLAPYLDKQFRLELYNKRVPQ